MRAGADPAPPGERYEKKMPEASALMRSRKPSGEFLSRETGTA